MIILIILLHLMQFLNGHCMGGLWRLVLTRFDDILVVLSDNVNWDVVVVYGLVLSFVALGPETILVRTRT